ncbi:hypothetical protein N9W89_06330 [Hellea sp.]|nr:hypothetical protein [Hellea sp.]
MPTPSEETPEILTPNEARAGRKTRFMPQVLGISVASAVILLLIVYAVFATTQS